MKNNRKTDSSQDSNQMSNDTMTVEVDDISSAPTSVATPTSGTSSPWAPQRDKSNFRQGPPSDRTSMSADSPGSRQSSVLTTHHNSVKLEVSRYTHLSIYTVDWSLEKTCKMSFTQKYVKN